MRIIDQDLEPGQLSSRTLSGVGANGA